MSVSVLLCFLAIQKPKKYVALSYLLNMQILNKNNFQYIWKVGKYPALYLLTGKAP
jgi:hypothetical protein